MKYNSFLFVFIISVIATTVFLIFYIQAIFSIMSFGMQGDNPRTEDFFRHIFTPSVIISFVVMAITTLAYKIMGIVIIANNKIIDGGEKALWIVGFIILGFVTSIVFLFLAKSRKLVETQQVS